MTPLEKRLAALEKQHAADLRRRAVDAAHAALAGKVPAPYVELIASHLADAGTVTGDMDPGAVAAAVATWANSDAGRRMTGYQPAPAPGLAEGLPGMHPTAPPSARLGLAPDNKFAPIVDAMLRGAK